MENMCHMEENVKLHKIKFGDRIKTRRKIYNSNFMLLTRVRCVHKPRKWYHFWKYRITRYYEYEYIGI